MASKKNGDDNLPKKKSGSHPLLPSPGDRIGRQLAGDALGISESFLHGILDQSPYPMWIADDQGTLIWLNHACRDLLHLTAGEVVGKYNVFQDNMVEQQGVLPLVRRVFEKGETVRFELMYDTSLLQNLQPKTATSVILDVTVSPVIDGRGRITNAVFQHVDITERKRAEEALKKEKLFTEAILDSLPGTFFLLDAQGKHLRTNTSGLMASGYSLEEMSQLHALDFIADEDKPAAQRALAEVFENGKTSIEVQHLAKNGRKTPFLFSAKKFLIDGMPYIIGTGLDISARKQAEEALRESEQRYRSLFQNNHSVMLLIDPETGAIMDANPTACTYYGFTRKELLAKKITDINILAPEQVFRTMQRIKGKARQSFEFRHRLANGEVRDVEVFSGPIRVAGKKLLYSIVHDVTARKEAEEALRESEKKYRSLYQEFQGILNTIPDILCLLSPDLKIVWGNEATAMQVGESNISEVVGKNCYPLRHERSEPCENCPVLRCFSSGKIETEEVVSFGGLWELRAVPLYDDQGELRGAIELARNITARKRIEKALEESEEQLRLALQAANQGFYDLNIQTGESKVSPEYATMLGYDPGNFQETDARWIERLHPDDREQVAATYQAYIRGDIPDYAVEFRQRTSSGQWKWILSMGKIVAWDENGKPLRMLGTLTDITQRKQMEESLARTQFGVDRARDAIHWVKADGGLAYVNQAFCDSLGYFPEELQSLSIFDIDPQISKELWPEIWRQSREKGSYVFETSHKTKEGRIFPVEIAINYIKFDGEEYHCAFARDISDRKEAEEAMLQSEARFRQVVESSPLPMGISKDSGEIEYVNPKFVETFGYTLKDLPRMEDWFRLAYPDPAYRQLLFSKWQKAWGRIKQDGVTEVNEVEITCKDGSRRIMQLFGTLMANKALVVFNDLTERKKAEIALRDSERRLSEIIDFLPDATLAVDLDGKVIAWNRAIEAMTGVKAESMMGKGNYEYALPFYGLRRPILMDLALVSDPEIETKYTFIKREGEILVCEADVPLKGEIHPLWAKARPLYNSEGKIVGAIETIRDLTERKRAEEERARLEAQMREVQKLESLGVLAGGIAHDFNNLLMVILGNADLALLAMSVASPARTYVEEISRGSLRAADLCRQMLAYSGKGRFVIGRYDLAEIVQEMAQMLKVSVSKKASLRYSFATGLPAVEVDATQMRQIIMNLIINASEAMEDQNGFISVATGVMDCDRAYLAESYLDDNLPEGRYVFLEVADTGCGMDDDTRRRIFDPFFTTKFTGRGLGLAAVLGIVRGHQGAIKVYSEPGQGTTFKALLPAVDWEPGERAATAAPGSRPLPGGTILLVDDDSHVRDVVSQMLERLGFKVLIATHGREGLEVFKANGGQIDCVILDLTMPEMAGDEVFRELRRLRKNVRVILSSGFNEQDVTQRFAGKGFAGFIQKPYTVSTLRETLNEVLVTK